MEEWWEAEIDVDDSDLPSLLRPLPLPSNPKPTPIPSLRPCSQSFLIPSPPPHLPPRPPSPPLSSGWREFEAPPPPRSSAAPPRLIPGPAGAVQAAMHRRATAMAQQRNPGGSCSEGEQLVDQRMVDVGEEEEDGDFKLNPWLCAMQFLDLSPGLASDSTSPSPISSIKSLRGTTERVPQVVGIVKSCVPNGLGDLSVTLKDPTDNIHASIHRRVLMEGNLGGEIAVGCVLILKQVVIFCPTCSACYLNVTLNNVVKLISKDCGPPCEQIMFPFRATCDASEKHREFGAQAVEREASLRHQAEIIADNDIRRNFNCLVGRDCGPSHKQMLPSFITTSGAAGKHRENGLEKVDVPSVRHGAESIAGDGLRGNLGVRMTNNRNADSPAVNLIVSTNAAAPPVKAANVDLIAREPKSKDDEEVRKNSSLRMADSIKADDLTGGLPFSNNAPAPPAKTAKLDLRANEPRKLISKASVAEWTDEQLLELFSDYQDNAELGHSTI